MRQALFIKIFLVIISVIGTFLASLFLYFMSSLRKSMDDINKKIDDLKQRYFQDLAGMRKIFVLQKSFDKFQEMLYKKLQKMQRNYAETTAETNKLAAQTARIAARLRRQNARIAARVRLETNAEMIKKGI